MPCVYFVYLVTLPRWQIVGAMYSKRCFTNEIERLKPLKMAAQVVFFHAVLIDTRLQYGVLKVWLSDSCNFFIIFSLTGKCL